MTNEERRRALNTARAKALEFAEAATVGYAQHGEDGPEVLLATMWAAVAEAMKDGDPVHDAPDGRPALSMTELRAALHERRRSA